MRIALPPRVALMVCLLAAAFLIALTLAGYEIFGEHARHLIANHGGTLGTTLRR